MIKNDKDFFFECLNPVEINFDKIKTIKNLNYFKCNEIIINKKKILSRIFQMENNKVFFKEDNLILNLKDLYIFDISNKKCELIQKKFTILFHFENNYFLENFYEKIKKWIIQNYFDEKYKILNLIDKGGFAKVYKIEKIYTKEILSVKKIEKNTIKNKKSLQYLKYEVQALRLLNHENILNLKEIFEDEKNIYIITEFLEGGTLRKKIKEKKIKKNEAIYITKSILKAIFEINKINFIHRDIKPENIIFTKNKDNKKIWKLIDFGLCTLKTDKFLMKDKSGTVKYLAPELIIGKPYNEKIDVFSIGIILLEMFIKKVI